MSTRYSTGTHALRRRLRRMQYRDGNWRLKGLLLSLRDDVDSTRLGHAWPAHDAGDGAVVMLGTRDDETHEHEWARQLYSADAISDGEVVPRDEYIKRALIAEAETELDVLWREEILDSVEAGARTRVIAREATTVTPMEAKKGTVPIHERLPVANTGAEAATAPDPAVDYTPVDYDTERHEATFALTDELVDEADPDALEAAIRLAGEAVENAINRQYIINVVDNANQNHSVGGNEVAVQDFHEAAENVADNDFDPVNRLAMHPEFVTEAADDPGLARINWAGADESEFAGEAYGYRLYQVSDGLYNGFSGENLDTSTSNTWGWEASSEIGAVVHAGAFVHTVVAEDISVSEFDAPFTAIHDLQGGVATARTDSVQASNDAISTLTQ